MTACKRCNPTSCQISTTCAAAPADIRDVPCLKRSLPHSCGENSNLQTCTVLQLTQDARQSHGMWTLQKKQLSCIFVTTHAQLCNVQLIITNTTLHTAALMVMHWAQRTL
jgi:hypothetical protein